MKKRKVVQIAHTLLLYPWFWKILFVKIQASSQKCAGRMWWSSADCFEGLYFAPLNQDLPLFLRISKHLKKDSVSPEIPALSAPHPCHTFLLSSHP